MASVVQARPRARHGCRLEMYKDFQEVPQPFPQEYSGEPKISMHGAVHIVAS
jgi:hypothetical protein